MPRTVDLMKIVNVMQKRLVLQEAMHAAVQRQSVLALIANANKG